MKDWIFSVSDQETSSMFPLISLMQHAAGSPTKCKAKGKKRKKKEKEDKRDAYQKGRNKIGWI